MTSARALIRLLGRAVRAGARPRRDGGGEPAGGFGSRRSRTARDDGRDSGPTAGLGSRGSQTRRDDRREVERNARRDGGGGTYPGDYTGVVRPVYAPDLDGDPDPGEIVWTWVPFEEDHSRGKDRPVLVVGRDDPWLLVLMLSTRHHEADPVRRDETWLDLGTGDWDVERRASEVRVDRVIRADPAAVRREGAVLDRTRFDLVVGSLAATHGC
jgi:hypothetical protein